MNGEMAISISADNFKRFKELAGLNEKQSRLFFGLYSLNLGRGGPKKVAEHFGVGINTVRIGLSEFKGEESLPESHRIRRPGAGRKATEDAQPGLKEAVQKALEGNSYGDPERVLFWSTLSLRDIQAIIEGQGFKASYVTVGRVISNLGYSKQQNQKLLQVREFPEIR